jgi:hypothetical protein
LWFKDFKEYIIEPLVQFQIRFFTFQDPQSQFFINKFFSESSSKSDLVLPTYTECRTEIFLVSSTVPPMKCDHIYH